MVLDLSKGKKYFHNRLKRLKNNTPITANNTKILLKSNNVSLALKYLQKRQKYLENLRGYEPHEEYRYYSTLNKEFTYVQNALYWFNKWNLEKIQHKEIEEIYVKLEKGELKSINGIIPSNSTKKDYYSKVFRNGFFKEIGLGQIATQVIKRKHDIQQDVRFFTIEDLKSMVSVAKFEDHKLLMWLLFDTGIEIKAALLLQKNDFSHINDETGQYYRLHIKPEIAKYKRARRDIEIWHDETNKILTSYLANLEENEYLFKFGYKNAYKYITLYAQQKKIKTKPNNDTIKVKDFRSSCATYFLGLNNWNSDDIKQRLGHNLSSPMIDRYASYLGKNTKVKRQEKIATDIEGYKDKISELEKNTRKTNEDLQVLKKSNKDVLNKWKQLTKMYYQEEQRADILHQILSEWKEEDIIKISRSIKKEKENRKIQGDNNTDDELPQYPFYREKV